MAHPRLPEVRLRYDFRCGYCGIHENEVGGELTVDHFKPVSLGGDDADENLVHACFRCNLFKADYWSEETERQLLHPLRDDVTEHFHEDADSGMLVAKTERGSRHIDILHLNRSQLVAQRLMRRLLVNLARRIQSLQKENTELRELIQLLNASLETAEE